MRTDPVTQTQDRPLASLSTAKTDTPQSIEGLELDPDEIADYEQLRRLVSREQSLRLLDDFAKWLFPTAAVVGALGAGFGASSGNSLSGTGRTLFAVAVALVGGSLALGALARLPLPGRVHLYSRQSMAAHVDRAVMVRGVVLTVAAVLFSAALVLAGVSPLFS